MCESEIVECAAPNWLSELEAKRERRLKARLGHEAGAGAPCLTCGAACPGLDLHFWRKICKNCKCSKESHDVTDDDIYGWAQFQLLGSRPPRLRHKIVLPGRKDEVELEWAPKGKSDGVVDKYLRTLPEDELPVKGSRAAQSRRHLLQKQIPIHDLDPNLCHELTDAERQSMLDYIRHVKEHSVGVGHVVQLDGVHRADFHMLDPPNAAIVRDRCQNGERQMEMVNMQTGNVSKPLKSNKQQQQDRPSSLIVENVQNPMKFHYKDVNYLPNVNKQLPNYGYGCNLKDTTTSNQSPLLNVPLLSINCEMNKKDNQQQTKPKLNDIKKFATTTFDSNELKTNDNNNRNVVGGKIPLKSLTPKTQLNIRETNLKPNIVNIATIQDINYDLPKEIDKTLNINQNETINKNGNNHILLNDVNELKTNNNNNRNIDNEKQLKSLKPNSKLNIIETNLQPNNVNIGAIQDINYDFPEKMEKTLIINDNEAIKNATSDNLHETKTIKCHRCGNFFDNDDQFAITIERTNALYHSKCFKCAGCNQNLADMLYFYDTESDNIYCGRDYAKIRGIPRCRACDELIFVKEYCLADNCAFHIKHFCCFECDRALAGENYVVDDDENGSQAYCLTCFNTIKTNRCTVCCNLIKLDETGATLNGLHFHANDICFVCDICKKPLLKQKLMLRNKKLYCSHSCFGMC